MGERVGVSGVQERGEPPIAFITECGQALKRQVVGEGAVVNTRSVQTDRSLYVAAIFGCCRAGAVDLEELQ